MVHDLHAVRQIDDQHAGPDAEPEKQGRIVPGQGKPKTEECRA
jgi:hypothetical protein